MYSTYISIGFAGNREHAKLGSLSDALREIFNTIEYVNAQNYTSSTLHIRMLNGLADGADIEAAEAFKRWIPAHNTMKYLVGIIPFGQKDYLNTITDKERFKKIYSECDSLIILDGRYSSDQAILAPGFSPVECRNRAYRQQAECLLASSDLLLAIAELTEIRKSGGTLETVEKALARRIPVIFLSLNDLKTYFINQKDALHTILKDNDLTLTENMNDFADVLRQIVF